MGDSFSHVSRPFRMCVVLVENGVEPRPECASHLNSFGERTVAAVAATIH